MALPLNMFYNTGIATYIWVLSNRKAAHRQGKVQLIDATQWFEPLRKNLGAKNCTLSDGTFGASATCSRPSRRPRSRRSLRTRLSGTGK